MKYGELHVMYSLDLDKFKEGIFEVTESKEIFEQNW